jgi:hypothetical protein
MRRALFALAIALLLWCAHLAMVRYCENAADLCQPHYGFMG